MPKQGFCDTCYQKHDCQEVCEHLGNSEGPSVAARVFLALLLPLVVFIVSLALFERILAGWISAERVRTAISFFLAVGATSVCVLITRTTGKYLGKDRQQQL